MAKTSQPAKGDPLRNSLIAMLTTLCVGLTAYAQTLSATDSTCTTPRQSVADTRTR